MRDVFPGAERKRTDAHGARAAAVVTKADQITTGAGIKAGGKKRREAAFALPRKKAHPRIRLSSVRFMRAGSTMLSFRCHPLSRFPPFAPGYPFPVFSFAISLDDSLLELFGTN